MKTKIKVFIFFILGFSTFIYCSKKDPVSSEKSYIAKGLILESNIAFENPIENAFVKIGDAVDTTNVEGEYLIENLKEGNYNVKVEHPQYASFDTIITINQNISQNLKIDRLPTLTGIIKEKTQSGFLPIQGALVVVGSHKSYSDSNGEYYINDLVKGNYQIQLSHPFYFTFDTTIYISGNEEKDYIMNPILDDYFPLTIGNEWKYKYLEYHYIGPYFEGIEIKGTKTWKIIDHYEHISLQRYKILDTFNGIKRASNPIGNIDTTFNLTDTTFFYIDEDSLGNLTTDLSESSLYVWAILPLYISMPRYNPARMPDSLIVNQSLVYLKYKKNTGITFLVYDKGPGTTQLGWYIELLDYYIY